MLIAIEGIDGAGKGTLARALVAHAEALGISAASLSFPRYGETKFSKLVADYLNGAFGGLDEVPVNFAALLFAGDRFESRAAVLDLLARHDLVILDRYVSSNAAYNGAKLTGSAREKLIGWIYETEFGLFEMPRPEVTILLTTDVVLSNELIARKGRRDYTQESHDLHEAARDYMSTVAEVYAGLAATDRGTAWYELDPMDGAKSLRPPAALCTEIWPEIAKRLKT